MPTVHHLTRVPANWADPILGAEEAAVLMRQPNHLLIALGPLTEQGHLLAHAVPGMPADILTLFVPEKFRRKGHARALMETFLAHAKTQGCPAATMEVRAANAPARALYETLGFTHAHTRLGYYSNPGDDAAVYTRALA